MENQQGGVPKTLSNESLFLALRATSTIISFGLVSVGELALWFTGIPDRYLPQFSDGLSHILTNICNKSQQHHDGYL